VLVIGAGWLIFSLYRGAAGHQAVQNAESGSAVLTEAASGADGTRAPTPVGARVSGVIQALACDINTRVKAGQLCAKIDPGPYQILVDQRKSDLASAEARLERDKADLAQAKAAFEQREALAKRRAISRKAVDKSRKAYEQVQARMQLDEAKAAQLQEALRAAEVNLGFTDIVAPVDGTVVTCNLEIGQRVEAGSQSPPLLVIATDPSMPK
jgi:RND family efflux transporter MFP subunit